MAAKISVIRIDKIMMTDNTVEMTVLGAVIKQSQRAVGNEDLVVKITVDKELDKNAKIVVEPSHVAFIIKNGKILETLEGGEYPVYDKKRDLARHFIFGKKVNVDSAHIVYVSKTTKVKMPWGTPRQMDMRDPVTDLLIKVGASGDFEIRVGDPRKFFLEVVGLEKDFSITKFQDRVLDKMMSEFQPTLAKVLREKQLTFYHLDEYRKEIAAAIAPILGEILEKNYGVTMLDFYINAIIIPEQMKQQIEAALAETRQEKKDKAKKAEEKQEWKEELAEMERLADKADDKEWARIKFMAELETRNREAYLEVCKAIGWEKNGKGNGNKFCPKCGEPVDGDFCGGCGHQIKATTKVCPKCNKVNNSNSKFCNGCGTKL